MFSLSAQDGQSLVSHTESVLQFQEGLNQQYRSPEASPLDSLKRIKLAKKGGHPFFEIDPAFRVEATFEVFENPEEVTMKTSSTKIKHYNLYGKATFQLNGKTYTLNLYQNKRTMMMPMYRNHLFLPFTDLTNGEDTYGGGRYIDIMIPADKTKIVIDFNRAYQPYCAYTYGYSCPVVPRENFLNTRIEAGVKHVELMEK